MQPDTALIEAANEVVGPLAAMVPLSQQCATYFGTESGIASHIGNSNETGYCTESMQTKQPHRAKSARDAAALLQHPLTTSRLFASPE